MKRRIIALATLVAMFAASLSMSAQKRELRSTWLATVWAIDWPASTNKAKAQEQMVKYLDHLAAHNFNGVCFQVRGLADAMYKSSYEPWNSVLTGTRGKDPGWDPLAFVVEECHKRGLECYAWVNPYRVSSSGKILNTDFDRKWEADGWLLSNGSYIVFNPAMAATRAHTLKVIKEIYTNYAIDGMLFDDYFYPSGGTAEGTSAPDYQQYVASGTKLSMADWRRKNVNDFMKEIYDNIQKDRPDMRFGLSPAGVAGKGSAAYGDPGVPVPAGDWQYDQIYSDPVAWLHQGSVDFISPQLYWKTNHSTAPFEPLTKWWSQIASRTGRHFYSSHSISLLVNDNTLENYQDIGKQVTLHRASQAQYRGEPGEIYYSAKNIDGDGSGGVSGLGNYLQSNVYTSKSLVPRLTWKDHPSYSAPLNAKLSGTTLSWSTVKGAKSNSIIRYSVYAIPSTVALDRARDTSGDGLSADYLVGISYTGSFQLTAEQAKSHYYAICVYDGYGYESQPALVNYNNEPSKKTTLKTPANGSEVTWNCNFSWVAVSGASYDLEIAQDELFHKTVILEQGIKTNSATVDLGRLKGSTTYYWRVYTNEPDRVGTASDAFTFTTPERPVGNFEEGYTVMTDVDKYQDNNGYSLTSMWHRSVIGNYGNFTPVSENGVLNRGMVATDGYVYVSGRSEASANADIYLQVYNAETGEHERDLQLSADGKCSYLPCNDIILDSNGHVCITNLTLNIAADPLKIYLVDLDNGNLTLVASVTSPGGGRVDHAAVYGDVISGDFTIFAAVASQPKVYRWAVTGGGAANAEVMTATEFIPSSADSWGIAPKVYPISESELYIDGGNTAAALYSFNNGKIIDSPAKSASHYTNDINSNGLEYFTIGSDNLLVYASASHTGDGYKFNIISSSTNRPLANGSLLWTIPNGTLGNVNSTTMSAPVSVLYKEPRKVNVYIYAPGNGIAAYRLEQIQQGIQAPADETPGYMLYSNVLVFDEPQEFIKAYNLGGTLVADEASATEAALPGTGCYVIVTPAGAFKVLVK